MWRRRSCGVVPNCLREIGDPSRGSRAGAGDPARAHVVSLGLSHYKRISDRRKVFNKFSIKISEADKLADSSYGRRGFLLLDYLHLFRVYIDPFAYLDNKPEIFHHLYFELVFVNI